jgi:hypothetical protein
MTTKNLEPRLQTIADRVSALQRMKTETGFQTKKSVRELLSPLTPDELAQVAEVAFAVPVPTGHAEAPAK